MVARTHVKEKYSRHETERRFARVYLTVAGDCCAYCDMPSEGNSDHRPPVTVLHGFANGGLVSKRFESSSASVNLFHAVPFVTWGLVFITAIPVEDKRSLTGLLDERFPEDKTLLELEYRLIEERLQRKLGYEVRVCPIYT